MKQTKSEPPVSPKNRSTAKTTPAVTKTGSKPAPTVTTTTTRRSAEAPLLTKPMIALIGGALLVLAAVIIAGFVLIQKDYGDSRDKANALGTALAATGYNPPSTPVPGSDLEIDVVIGNLRDFTPLFPGEQVNLYLINPRDKSFYVSNCDGVVLQRFTGTDATNKTQEATDTNWHTVAPGGFKFCGPATGRQAIQVSPGDRADASFKFDRSQTRPFTGESWDIPGTYRLLVTYYLQCPDATLQVSDCLDQHTQPSDNFKIVAPPAGYTPGPTPKPTATPGPTLGP